MDNRNQPVSSAPVASSGQPAGPGQPVGPNRPVSPRPPARGANQPAGPRPPARGANQPTGPMPAQSTGVKPSSVDVSQTPGASRPPKKAVAPQPAPQPPSKKPEVQAPAPRPPKSKGGWGTKILMVLLIFLILGVAGVGAYFYLGLSSKDSSLDSKIGENKATSAENKDKVDKLQTSASEVETLKQKVDAMEKESADYAQSSKLETIMTYLKTEDSDKDGLSDYDEVMIYKSSRYKKDTDGDGYDDKTEVDGGFNPNGPGRLSDTSTSDTETTTIIGEWKGDISSTSSEAEDVSVKFDENGKVTGSFSFKKDDDTTINSTVTGTYTYKDNKFDAILVNSQTVKDTEEGTTSKGEQYKMDLTGTFSNDTKAIVGGWKIIDGAPSNWPAGPSGSFKIAKNVTTKSETLDDTSKDTSSDDDSKSSDDSSTLDDSSTTAAKKISVKAFSYGFLPTTITLTKGEKVKFEITSLDVDHTFTVDKLNINVQVKGGQTTTIEFTPSEVGEYEYYSSISGQKDSGMKGMLTVEEAEKSN